MRRDPAGSNRTGNRQFQSGSDRFSRTAGFGSRNLEPESNWKSPVPVPVRPGFGYGSGPVRTDGSGSRNRNMDTPTCVGL
ncbi:hypothetical protein JCGZ_03124 [Jatropha curcas]|uniref:Uncharacterized protein n=1 Tax=Jatropha curcas TaxID=180498 RepID=A0A067JDL0_JATCU|nr:hypothetical protein JCGZ_03124 [Jatropha curcas]